MAATSQPIGRDAPSAASDATGRLEPIPALDGLRGLAIAAVLTFHVHDAANRPVIDGGFLGVDVFFVLSGFLITTLLVDEHRATGRIRLGAFWGRRFARVVPLAWALLAVAALTVVRPVAGFRPPSPHGFLAGLTFTANWIPVSGAYGMYQLQFLWSVAVEVQFYVLWPPVVVLLLRRGNPDLVAAVALAAAGTVMVLRPTVFADTDYFFHTFLRCDGLLLGAALGATRSRWQRRIPVGTARAMVALGLGAAAAMIAVAVDGDPAVSTWQLPVLELGVAAAIAGLVAGGGRAALGWRPLVGLGVVSYALYLVHLPIFDLVEARIPVGQVTGRRIAIELGLALAAAVAAHVVLEDPANRALRRRLSPGSGRRRGPRTSRS